MRLRTANKNRKRRLRQQVYEAALRFHGFRVYRLSLLGQLHKIRNSGFVLREKRRYKQ